MTSTNHRNLPNSLIGRFSNWTFWDTNRCPMDLVPFSSEHIVTLASWFPSERDLVQWAGPTLSFPIDHGELQAMIDQGRGAQPGRLCWMARRDGAFVGHAQLGFDWRNGNATLSRVALAPRSRGHGLARPMIRCVIDKAFGHPEIERIDLNVYPFNTPAIRAYARLGFAAEGVRRSSARVGSERWDTAIMGLLRSEWLPEAIA